MQAGTELFYELPEVIDLDPDDKVSLNAYEKESGEIVGVPEWVRFNLIALTFRPEIKDVGTY